MKNRFSNIDRHTLHSMKVKQSIYLFFEALLLILILLITIIFVANAETVANWGGELNYPIIRAFAPFLSIIISKNILLEFAISMICFTLTFTALLDLLHIPTHNKTQGESLLQAITRKT